MIAIGSMKIIIDQRERNPDIINCLEKTGIDIERKTLPVGDYVVSNRICIERKTISDFESSLINGRLFDQIERLKQAYEFPIVLIEGNIEEFRLGLKQIIGAIISIYINYKIEVIFCFTNFETAEVIANIIKKEQENKDNEPSLKGSFKAHSDNQIQEYIVGNLPGIGPKLAKKLLIKFKNIKNLANADVDELTKIDKIGKIKAKKIHEIINKNYAESDKR